MLLLESNIFLVFFEAQYLDRRVLLYRHRSLQSNQLETRSDLLYTRKEIGKPSLARRLKDNCVVNYLHFSLDRH